MALGDTALAFTSGDSIMTWTLGPFLDPTEAGICGILYTDWADLFDHSISAGERHQVTSTTILEYDFRMLEKPGQSGKNGSGLEGGNPGAITWEHPQRGRVSGIASMAAGGDDYHESVKRKRALEASNPPGTDGRAGARERSMGFVTLAVGCILGIAVFRVGVDAGWHWSGALGAALIPIALTVFLGIFGILIGGSFLAALWKATA